MHLKYFNENKCHASKVSLMTKERLDVLQCYIEMKLHLHEFADLNCSILFATRDAELGSTKTCARYENKPNFYF